MFLPSSNVEPIDGKRLVEAASLIKDQLAELESLTKNIPEKANKPAELQTFIDNLNAMKRNISILYTNASATIESIKANTKIQMMQKASPCN